MATTAPASCGAAGSGFVPLEARNRPIAFLVPGLMLTTVLVGRRQRPRDQRLLLSSSPDANAMLDPPRVTLPARGAWSGINIESERER